MRTSLLTDFPQLANEWHPTLNESLSPTQVASGNNKKVWWLGNCGHEWKATISNRTFHNSGCPYCANKKVLAGFNDLATSHPQLAREWHLTRNGNLMPEMIIAGSHKKVWWLGKCGHEWDAIINSRSGKHSGCPYCSGHKILAGYNDITTTHPLLAQQWHPTKNGSLLPTQVSAGSQKYAWWQCTLGHEWKAILKNRTAATPVCIVCSGQQVLVGYNDLATTHPQLIMEWHPTLNENITPQQVSFGSSSKKVWWQCAKGHEWQTKIKERTRIDGKATGCPQCWVSTFISRGEQEIADYLTNELGLTIEQSNRKIFKDAELDIYIPSKKLAIEYNGVYWHSSAIQSDCEYHQKKYEQAQQAGIQLLQIWEDDWENKSELVKRLLAHKLGESREPLIGARQTFVEAIPLAEARTFLNEYHIQGHSNGSYYLGLRSKTNKLVALMVLVKRANPVGLTLEISRYATSCRVPGGFTKLLKHVETTLQPSRLVTFADHCISDGGLYAQNGFAAEKELAPDYRYLVNKQRAHKFGYRLARFKADPSLLWEPNLTETQLAALNGLHRVYDAGKTRWVKTL